MTCALLSTVGELLNMASVAGINYNGSLIVLFGLLKLAGPETAIA